MNEPSSDDWGPMIRRARQEPLRKPVGALLNPPWGRPEIEKILPHREGCLVIDAVRTLDLPGQAIFGTLDLERNPRGFGGHFPGDPVYPAALQIEAIGQLGACLLHALEKGSGALWLRVLRVHHAFFSREIRPGEKIDVLAFVSGPVGLSTTLGGQLLRGAEVCSFALMEVCHE